MHDIIENNKINFFIENSIRPCLFVLLLLSFRKNWLMTSWITDCLILVADFYNIYLVFCTLKV
jgi:hypothetical protein